MLSCLIAFGKIAEILVWVISQNDITISNDRTFSRHNPECFLFHMKLITLLIFSRVNKTFAAGIRNKIALKP